MLSLTIFYLLWLVASFFISAIANAILMNFNLFVNIDTVLILWVILGLLPLIIFKNKLKSKIH